MSIDEKYEKEWDEVKKWAIQEEDKVTARLKAEGIYPEGLDTGREHYKYISIEVNRRLKDIQERYGKEKGE